MDSILLWFLGIFGGEPLITVDVKVDINVNIPGVEREEEYFGSTSLDYLFMER